MPRSKDPRFHPHNPTTCPNGSDKSEGGGPVIGIAASASARKVLAGARLAAQLSQKQLSARLRRRPSFICQIERGTLPLRRENFVAIARALHLDPKVLFEEMLAGLPNSAASSALPTAHACPVELPDD